MTNPRDAPLDGGALDVLAISHDQEDVFGRELREAILDGFHAGSGDHDDQILHLILIPALVEELPPEAAFHVGKAGADDAHPLGGLPHGEEKLEEVLEGEQAHQLVFAHDDGDAAVAAPDHPLVHIEEGLVRGGGSDVALGDGSGGEAHVHEQIGMREAGLPQDPLRARGERAAPGGDRTRLAGAAEEIGIGDGGANGVGIRIPVTDDIGGAGISLHGVERESVVVGGESTGLGGGAGVPRTR